MPLEMTSPHSTKMPSRLWVHQNHSQLRNPPGANAKISLPWYRGLRLVTVPRFTSTVYVNECRVEMDSGIASNVIAPEAVRRGVGPVVWWIGEPVHFLR
jgi:hypothetical protein